MKKIHTILILLAMISLSGIVNAQNWLTNDTNWVYNQDNIISHELHNTRFCVDNDLASATGNDWGSPGDVWYLPASIYFDFFNNKTLTDIRLYLAYGYPYGTTDNFQLYCSNNSTGPWTEVLNISMPTSYPNLAWYNYSFPQQTARYWKLTLQPRDKQFVLYEVNFGEIVQISPNITVNTQATIQQNDTVEVSINTSALQTADGIISYQFKLGYDATRLTYLSNSLTGTLDNGGVLNVNSGTSGLLNIGYMTSTALSGQGSLVKVKFIATQTLGDANFTLSDFVYNTTAVTDLVNDMVTVIDGIPPTGAVTYSILNGICREGDALQITVTFDENMADVPIPQLNFTGVNTLTNTNMIKVNSTVYTYDYVVQHGAGNVNVNIATGTDLAGNIVVATPTSGTFFTILPTVYGDIDTNDIVQAYDAALALQYSVAIDPLPTSDPLPWSNWRKIVGNVDATGDITANDAALILQYSIGLITTFPVGSKSIQENPIADITITQENNEIVFTSTGELYGLNIYSSNGTSVIMGNPNVLDPNMLNVTNINSSVYNIGLCTAYSPVENYNIMRIPFTCTAAESITFNMIINKNSVVKSINLNPVGIIENKIQSVNIFPNPANDKIVITGLNNGTIEIINSQGQIVKTSNLTNSKTTVDLTKISGGVYTIKIKSDNGIIVKQLIKQ